MRIADITEFYSPTAGVRAHLTTKGHALRDAGHDHLVIAPGAQHADEHLPAALPAKSSGSARVVRIKGPTLPYDPNYHLLWRVDRARRAVLDFDPHVVSFNSLYMASVALASLPARLRAVRIICWHADFIDTYLRPRLRCAPEGFANALLAPFWAAVRTVANSCAATLVASKCQAEKLRAQGVKRVVLLPFGVETQVFRPAARSSAVRTELLGPSSKARLLVGVGRLSAEKRWDVVIEAVHRLCATQPVKLVIFGRGPEEGRLRALADPSVVSLAGLERDRGRVAAALSSADVYVHGSSTETYGLSVAEAMACGVPIVAPKAGAVLDLVDGSHAQTYEAGSAVGCSVALERVLGPELGRYRSAALAAAPRVPDSTQQVLEILRIYRSLMGNTQRSLS